MPLQATSGAATYDAFGGGVAAVPNYIEDVFSTWLYTGNGSTQTITNGIDLAGKGGLVWLKSRSAGDNVLFDTARGTSFELRSNATNGNITQTNGVTAFNSSGFSLGTYSAVNGVSTNRVSWTFRKQPKFFDIVTWTGNDVERTIAHNLGSVPGCIMVKRLDTAADWRVYHRANTASPQNNYLVLNTTAATVDPGITPPWNDTEPTASVFSIGTESNVNASGGTYIAYLFAHNAGGFGLTGTDNVISCGSYTGTGTTGLLVTLGYEPQWILVKDVTTAGWDWYVIDNMRGFIVNPASPNFTKSLSPNTASAESDQTAISPTATGFRLNSGAGAFNSSGDTYIYIAIRRGPMKTPTTGTSVLGISARTGTGADATVTGSAGVTDAALIKNRGSAVGDLFASRLTGTGYLETSSTAAEVAAGTTILQANPWDVMDGVKVGTTSTITNASSNTYINYLFRRAPGFFDEVCYTGSGTTSTNTHNLKQVPELMIIKSRTSSTYNWIVYSSAITAANILNLNTTSASTASSAAFNNTSPTASVFTVGTSVATNAAAATYVAYLFATCPGVSKVGSYTGSGTTKQIDCGFTGGARFVLIKRTDSTGDWYVWDSARGIVAGNDPYLLLNSAAAEVTSTDYIDTYSAGFEISSTAPAAINANGGTFIYLAIA